jgi:hypothetical protein
MYIFLHRETSNLLSNLSVSDEEHNTGASYHFQNTKKKENNYRPFWTFYLVLYSSFRCGGTNGSMNVKVLKWIRLWVRVNTELYQFEITFNKAKTSF